MLRVWAPMQPLPERLYSFNKRVFTCWFSLLKLTGLACGPMGDCAKMPFTGDEEPAEEAPPLADLPLPLFLPFLWRSMGGGETQPLWKLFTSEIMWWWLLVESAVVVASSLRFSACFLTRGSTTTAFTLTTASGFLSTTALLTTGSVYCLAKNTEKINTRVQN